MKFVRKRVFSAVLKFDDDPMVRSFLEKFLLAMGWVPIPIMTRIHEVYSLNEPISKYLLIGLWANCRLLSMKN
ncbi:hypothetical protein ACLB2K_041475 [Fragaria x ananassa]